MTEDVQQSIDRLKAALLATTDADLARKLRVDRSTIASWKARGKVPDRFSMIEHFGQNHASGIAPAIWDLRDKLCFSIALFRFCRTHSETIMSDDFRKIHDFFFFSDFWNLVAQAEDDMRTMQENRGYSEQTAFSMLVYEDLQDLERMKDRVTAISPQVVLRTHPD